MPARAMKVKTNRTVVITDITCSAKRRADSLPSPSRRRAYCGTKAALNAPSAKRLRNRFGKRWETKKASAASPVPSAWAIRMSRIKPSTRLASV